LRNARGAAAVEFAMVAPPFLALVVGIIEIGVDYYFYAQLETATQQAVQDIRTGTVQIKKLTQERFRNEVFCPKIVLLSCDKLVFNVAVMRAQNDWGAFSPTTVDPAKAKWCVGGAREIVLVQVAYPVPLATMIWAGDTSLANGQRYYLASAGFRNEPFGVADEVAENCA
jgi:Flp pilus assembly protein TadG